jgi:hypothetical protein
LLLHAQEAAAAADALGRSGAYAVCQLVLDSVPAALALSLRAGLPRPVQAVAPLGPVSFFVFLDRCAPAAFCLLLRDALSLPDTGLECTCISKVSWIPLCSQLDIYP